MTDSIARLMDQLVKDPWREEVGFSDEVAEVNAVLYAGANDSTLVERALDAWLLKHQPCLFGRIGARLHSLTYCVITDAHLAQSDEAIAKRIQQDRARWKRAGYAGESSAFLIVVISPILASAIPNTTMLDLARRLCQLYLVADDVQPNRIYVDQLDLEVPVGAARRGALTFDVGVNYFCAQGDKRWWQDHRIPGGMAFSMNSVGHLVRSAILARAMGIASELVLGSNEDIVDPRVDSLEKALVLAMRTISNAADAVSGKATALISSQNTKSDVERCPFALPRALEDYDCHRYTGFYHTDETLPFDYFRPDVVRPSNVATQLLDFTYLYDDRLDNPAHVRMGAGVRTRSATDSLAPNRGELVEESLRKRPRAQGRQK